MICSFDSEIVQAFIEKCRNLLPCEVIAFSLFIFTFLSTASALIGYLRPIVILNDNQILYLFSTSAQVIAAIYGLTLTGYIFLRSELNREQDIDNSKTEVIDSLKKRYYSLLIFITFLSIFTILISNFAISYASNTKSLFSIPSINIGQSLLVVNLFVISYFIFDILDPKNIERAGKALQQSIDPPESREHKGSVENFLNYFVEIDSVLQKYGQSFFAKRREQSGEPDKPYNRVPTKMLVDTLFRENKITLEDKDEIKHLISLRSAIVNGAVPEVSLKIENSARNALNKLSTVVGQGGF
ncbi:MAG: hypothetical protein Q7U77_09095 [Sediminibacterium sp.]|uniref:hypothetical protein n=1 Tax=Sediminibacterium sp. TaxID=1917865 RepID=UPI0027221BFA|nr:hypothetical protein [Sediminibacterium sp.]MDO8996773.1 hypothetical protein [Sediminibacterium sp.]